MSNTDYLIVTWTPGNLEDDGTIVPYDGRYTTLEYLTYSSGLQVINTVPVVLCTYDANHSVLTRTVNEIGSFIVERNTMFRLCAVGVSSSAQAASSVSIVTHLALDKIEVDNIRIKFDASSILTNIEGIQITDPTLSVPGIPADAKATGDAIDELYNGKKSTQTITWVPGNLEDDGSIVPYSNRFTTEEYLSYRSDIRVVNDVLVILCTYNANHGVLSRTAKNAGAFKIERNTIFRICAVDVSSSTQAASTISIKEQEGVATLIENLNEKIDVLAGAYVTAYLNSTWTPGNLEDDGSIVPYSNRYTTEQYMSYGADITVTSSKVTVACTYDSNHDVLTRTVQQASQAFTIPKNTIFRVTAVGVGTPSEAKESTLITFGKEPTAKMDAPSIMGTTGQFLSLGGDLTPVWVDPINDLKLIQCFETFGVIGDSISAGFTDIGGTTISSANAVLRKANWPSYMELDIGRIVTDYAQGGSATIDWRNTYKSNLEVKECYILYLGGNDMSTSYALGSPSDIATSFANNALSYYGNYDYLVRYIHSIAPKSVIFCISNTKYDSGLYATYNEACEYIAGLYSYCHYINIIPKVVPYTEFFDANFNGHFSPIAYNLYGKCIQKALNEYIYSNASSFLGIPYSTDPTT